MKRPSVTTAVNRLNEFPALSTIPKPFTCPSGLLRAKLGFTLPSVGGGITDQESRLLLDKAISKGRGGIFLTLAIDQSAKLKA